MAVNTLISVRDAANQANAIFVDCRFSLADPAAGRAVYEQNHIAGAVYADLEEDLSGQIISGETGRHPLPEKNTLVQTVRGFGISNHQPVIAYDADNGAFAARLWWLLRHLGHSEVWVLDGGIAAWQAAGLETSNQAMLTEPSDFEASESLCQVVDADHVQDTDLLLDARDPARFRGDQEPIDPVAGHIPGAICVPFANNLTADVQFKTPAQLKQQFVELGLSAVDPATCYCGSGVTACHNILAIRHAGLPEPRLYPGSWSEWITDPTRDVATGDH